MPYRINLYSEINTRQSAYTWLR